MYRPRSRVLAGVASLAIGGMFVAASAIGALADSPAPTGLLTATVQGQTVTVSGSLIWGNKCAGNNLDAAGFGVVWGDTGDLGLPIPGDTGNNGLVGLTGHPGGVSDNNLVHPVTAGCGFSDTHTYVASLPAKVCAIGYHVSPGQTSKPFHSIYEADAPGQPGNTDNSVAEPPKNAAAGVIKICADIVKKLSDVALTETGTPASVTPGDTITYTVPVGNTGSKSATSTTQAQHLVVTLDGNTTLVSLDKGGWTNCFSVDAHTIHCDYNPLLGVGVSILPPLTIQAKVLDNGETSVTSTAHVDNGDNSDDADTSNQSAQVRTPVVPQGISIDKTATPQVKVGDPITYTMKVTNNGTMTTNGAITVTDTFPAGVTPDPNGASGANWTCVGVASITCTWNGGDLQPGQSTTLITETATALESAVPHVTNTAFAHMGNITVQDSATTIVNTDVNLTLHKSADPVTGSDVELNQPIDYTLHYANTGATDANGVTITDAIPVGTTYTNGSAHCSTACTVSFSNNTLTFSLNIPANSSGDASFEVTVNGDDVNGQVINNQAQMHFSTTDIPSNITHHRVVVPSGDLNLVKSVSYTKPAGVGSVLTYKLVASATGNMDQTQVVVTDVVPDGTSYVDNSATCSAASCTADNVNGTVTWQWPTLSPGHPVTLTFQVTVKGPDASGTIPTEIINVGSIRSHETPPTPSNRVIVPLTQVLGTKIVKTPTSLPFTGLNSLQDALLAAVLIGAGMLILTWPRLQSQSRRVA